MTENRRPNLASIEPIGPAPEKDEADEQRDQADRVGLVAAIAAGSPPAVGVAAEQMNESPPETASEDARRQSR